MLRVRKGEGRTASAPENGLYESIIRLDEDRQNYRTMSKREVAMWMLAIRMAVWDANGGDSITEYWYADLDAHPHLTFLEGCWI